MSSSRPSSSRSAAPSLKVEVEDQSSNQITVFSPRPIIIPSTHNLPRIMKMSSNLQDVLHDYMDTVDVCDIVQNARQSAGSSSTKDHNQTKEISLWQFMSSPTVRIPYRPSLWSMLLKGLQHRQTGLKCRRQCSMKHK